MVKTGVSIFIHSVIAQLKYEARLMDKDGKILNPINADRFFAVLF